MRCLFSASVLALSAGLSSMLGGCVSGQSKASELKPDVVNLPTPPAGMPKSRVYVGDFSVSPAVVIPPEMQEIGHAELINLAKEHIQQELGKSTAFEVVFTGPDGRVAVADALPIVGEITRVELTGNLEDQLTGVFGRQIYTAGQSVTVRRDLVLGINYRILRPDMTAAAVGTGQSKTKIPISGVFDVVASNEEGSARTRSTLKDGKVDRSGLAPAFQNASSVGSRELILNAIQKWTAEAVPQAVYGTTN